MNDTTEQLRIHNGRVALSRWERRLSFATETRNTFQAWADGDHYAGLADSDAEPLRNVAGLAETIAGLDRVIAACETHMAALVEFAEQPKKKSKRA